MRQEKLDTSTSSTPAATGSSSSSQRPFPTRLLVIFCAFVLVSLVSVVPLNRLAGTTELAALPTNAFLLLFGALLPTDLHLSSLQHASQVNTDSIEFLSLMAILFLLYVCAIALLKNGESFGYKKSLMLIYVGAVTVGVIYMLTPSLLSRDAFVYAGYGRVIITHHANPYYTPLSAFPHDPLLAADDWRTALAAYGPLWLLICAIAALISGKALLPYLFFFRLLGFVAHLCNIALINALLRKWGQPQRFVLTGTLLYAWNPLVLLESCLGAHNDTLMVTCLLVGIYLTLRVEQDFFNRGFLTFAPVVAFSAALLIKFTAAPLLAFYLVLLGFRTFKAHLSHEYTWNWFYIRVGSACFLAVVLIFAAYTPLWLGHSFHDIIASQASPPSSRLAFGSILLALQKMPLQGQASNPLLVLLRKHSVWNGIDLSGMLLLFVIGVVWLWHVPTTRTLLCSSLAVLGALLLVTPWFFPWYVVWLIGLAAPIVRSSMTRVEQALLWSTITFSASALFIYLFRGYPPVGDWVGVDCLTTIGPPLLVFLIFIGTSFVLRVVNLKYRHTFYSRN